MCEKGVDAVKPLVAEEREDIARCSVEGLQELGSVRDMIKATTGTNLVEGVRRCKSASHTVHKRLEVGVVTDVGRPEEQVTH